MGLRNVDGVVKPLPSSAGSRQKPTLPVLGKLSQRIIFDDQLLTLGSRLAATDLKVACAAAKKLGYALLRNASAQREAIGHGISEPRIECLIQIRLIWTPFPCDAHMIFLITMVVLIQRMRRMLWGLQVRLSVSCTSSRAARPLPERYGRSYCTGRVCARHPVNRTSTEWGAVEALISLVGFHATSTCASGVFRQGSLAASMPPPALHCHAGRCAHRCFVPTNGGRGQHHATLGAIRARLGHLEGQLEVLATAHDACPVCGARVAAAVRETSRASFRGASSQKRLRGWRARLVEVLPRVIDLDALVTGGIVDGMVILRGADGHVKIDRLLEHANGYVARMTRCGLQRKLLVGKDDKPPRATATPTQAGYGAATQGGGDTTGNLCATTCRAIDALLQEMAPAQSCTLGASVAG